MNIRLSQIKKMLRPIYNRYRGPKNEKHIRSQQVLIRKLGRENRITYDPNAIKSEVRLRVAGKGISPQESGKLRIVTTYPPGEWTGEQLAPALQAFGEEVYVEVSPQPSRGWLKKGRDRYNAALLETIKAEHQKGRVTAFFFYTGGNSLKRETLQQINALGIATLMMGLDDMSGIRGPKVAGVALRFEELVDVVDLSYTSTLAACKEYLLLKGRPLYLPMAGNHNLYRKLGVEKEIDVLMLGWRMPSRERLVKRLRAAGFAVKTAGPGWPGGRVPIPGLVRLINAARIVVGNGDHNPYNVTDDVSITTLKARDFEAPLAGSLYLTTFDPELQSFYHIGSEILCYRDWLDAELIIEEMLQNPAKREAIAEAGYQRALAEHTWEARFRQIFQFMGLLPNMAHSGQKQSRFDNQ